MLEWQVDWQTSAWLSGFLVFGVSVDGVLQHFAVAASLLTVEDDETPSATLERNIVRIRRAVACGPIWEQRNGMTLLR